MPRTRKTTATTKVINPEMPEKTEPMTTASTVLIAYNGVQAQAFDVPMGNGQKKRIIINGNNADLIGKARGELYAGGYGLTAVDREAWEWIYTHYKNWGPIKSGLMFASTESDVNEAIKARSGLKNGFEPLKGDTISGVEKRKTDE